MISTLELKQFRGLEHVKFENLGRANLIIGGNNTGKTSILEALVLLYGSSSQLTELPVTFRVQPGKSKDVVPGFWRHLPKGGYPSALLIESEERKVTAGENTNGWQFIEARSNQNSNVIVVIEKNGHLGIPNRPSAPTISIVSTKQEDPGEVSELFNQIAPLNPKNEAKLEELLRKSIDPRLRVLRYARPQGTQIHLVYADLGEGPMLPFTQLGQAFARTLQIYCEIFASRPKLILIDEIESGLYYEGMEDFWKGLMAVLEDQDVQLFATTHSRECMEAAHKAAASMEGDPLRFLRLDRRVDDPGKIVATTFGKEEMQTAIEFNREMR